MARHIESGRFGLLAVVATLGSFVACGGSSGDDDDDASAHAGAGGSGARGGSGNRGVSGNATSGGSGGGSSTELGFPAALPASTAECADAGGSDGCYYAACCTELVACAKNAACKKTYGCYVTCPSDDSDCFVSCAGSSLADGADDFGTALGCLAPLALSCGKSAGGGEGGLDGGGNAGAGGGTTTPPDVGPLGSARDSFGWDLNVSDEPLVAELEPDVARAVSKTVTVEGGKLTAEAADGTTFELTIPEAALYGPTVITLTPLASLAVPPLAGPAYGVQIEPDGLELMGSPSLRITPPPGDSWPVDQQIPLSITGKAHTASLALLEPDSEELVLALTHFSSYGTLLSQKGLGATLSANDIRTRFAGDAESRLQSAAAERLGRERMKELLGVGDGGENVASLVEGLFPEYEEHVLKPRVAKAGESCAAGRFAIQTVLGFERAKALLGVEGDGESAFVSLLPVVAKVCLEEEYELCRDHHIISRILVVLLSYARQAQLLGLSENIPPSWVLDAENSAKKCLKFELRLDSDVLYSDTSPDTSMNESVTSSVPAALTGSFVTIPTDVLPPAAQENGALILGGPAPLESTAYAVHTNERCRTIDDTKRVDGELYVSMLSFTPGIPHEDTPGGSPEVLDFGVSLALSPNLSSYTFTQQEEKDSGCGDVIANGEEVLSWSSTLGAYLLEQNTTGENGAYLTEWEIQHDAGQILAVKDLSLNGADGSATYRGPVNLVLLHTPDP